MSPLLCFETIEWHCPKQVLRQFDLHQGISPSCLLEQELHLVDRQECHKYDWETYHAQYVALWATRAEMIVTSPPTVGITDFHDPFKEWYRHIIRSLITPPLHRDQMMYHNTAASSHLLVSKRL